MTSQYPEYLYPVGYKGESATPKPVDRTPTAAQRAAAKAHVETLLTTKPLKHEDIIPLLEQHMPHTFTQDEMVGLFREMDFDHKEQAAKDVVDALPEFPKSVQELTTLLESETVYTYSGEELVRMFPEDIGKILGGGAAPIGEG